MRGVTIAVLTAAVMVSGCTNLIPPNSAPVLDRGLVVDPASVGKKWYARDISECNALADQTVPEQGPPEGLIGSGLMNAIEDRDHTGLKISYAGSPEATREAARIAADELIKNHQIVAQCMASRGYKVLN